ncbi:hypothetical protein N865_06505 [Intrasporangium oryzae NRRL B-24470]|uniref:DUF937 domain-containing protein n=1 Tax=Intrasporangium oryzae NRRL B-24470 TaxID=1386089 RepID=W9GED6_9MICO|nr:DUF937 domain-containing protein [Intrasporangium oryzae]EWT02239.1 hypothetical protein N865_06505 [Intrasporangium oryzae NRRL B-24470]
MSSYDEILDQVPVSQLAQQLGVDESEVTAAAESALPALLGGLQANAGDPAGADSLMAALAQHQGGITGVQDIDVADGEKIVGNIFGDQTDQVVNQLGGLGGGASGGLVQKLLPMLAPIVMSWLAGKIASGGGLGSLLPGGAGGDGGTQVDSGPLFPGGQGAQSAPTQDPSASSAGNGSNPLQEILGSVLGGGSSTGGGGAGDILGGLLGGLLGGGKR